MRLCRAERFPPVYNLNSRRSQMSMKLVRCVAEPTSHSTVLQVGGPPFTCGCVAFWRIKPLDISATVLATIRKFEGEGVPRRNSGEQAEEWEVSLDSTFLFKKVSARRTQLLGGAPSYILSSCSSYQGSAGRAWRFCSVLSRCQAYFFVSLVASLWIDNSSPSTRHFKSSYGNHQPMAHPVFVNEQAMHHLPASASV